MNIDIYNCQLQFTGIKIIDLQITRYYISLLHIIRSSSGKIDPMNALSAVYACSAFSTAISPSLPAVVLLAKRVRPSRN